MVAAVHGIGQPQHGSQFTCPDTSFSITERIQITADHLCHDLPFCVGQADDLCGHDDVISAGAGITVREAIRYGVARGLFSNEAGMGSTPHAHARAKAESPHHQGLCAMVSVFIDTFIVLNLTVFSVLTTGVMSSGKDGTALTQAAFMKGFGSAGIIFVAVCLFFFAFSTILSWHFFGLVNVKYLFGEKASKLYSLIVVVCIVIGSSLKLELVWSLADFFNGLMVIPNVLALLALSGLVVRASKER